MMNFLYTLSYQENIKDRVVVGVEGIFSHSFIFAHAKGAKGSFALLNAPFQISILYLSVIFLVSYSSIF